MQPADDEVWARRRQLQQERADAERQRAAWSARIAARHEAQATLAPESLRPLHAEMAAVHRRTAQRHLASAQLHDLLAARMDRWLGRRGADPRAVLIAAVADALGTPSALAVLYGRRRAAALVEASDSTARAAHDLEIAMAEGPAFEAARDGMPVMAAGTALLDRWPQYGPAVAELDVRAVVAAPLGPPSARIGALCVLGREPAIAEDIAPATTLMADAVTRLVLRAAGRDDSHDGLQVLPLLGSASQQAAVHQAAGMVSVQCGCSIEDAHDLLAMRAFADGVLLTDIAAQVVRGQTRFR